MATQPRKKSSIEELQSRFGELVRKQASSMSDEEALAAHEDVKAILKAARASHASRREKAK